MHTPQEPIRIILYSHDSQGLGHVRRNLALAHHIAREVPALTGRQVAGLLVSGLPHASTFPLPPGFDWLFIPSVCKSKGAYASRSLGTSTRSVVDLRSQLLQTALLGFAPDVLIIDRHIFGVMRELKEPLAALRAQKPSARVVLGLREVLDAPEVAHAEWYKNGNPQELREVLDALWIYGDPAVHNPLQSGEIPEELADLAHFTGYLASGRHLAEIPVEPVSNKPYILTTAGGGEDGYALLRTLVEVSPPPGYTHLVVAGPQLPTDSFEALRKHLAPGVELVCSLPGLSQHIQRAAAVISMGGYNTSNEILATSTPALIVPRESPRTEQLIRAQALARAGAVDYLRLKDLTTAAVHTWLDQAIHRRVDRSGFQGHGLTTAAHLLADSIHQPTHTHH